MFKIFAIPVLLFVVFFAMPRGCQDLRDTRLLADTAQVTRGAVLRHTSNVDSDIQSSCSRFRAIVGYRVGGQDHEVVAEGCGALPARLPLGTAVDVRYAPAKPAVSEAVIQDTESKRWGFFMMAALAVSVPLWLVLSFF
jgi:hypothetical protein